MVVYKTTNLVNNKIYIGQDSKNNDRYLGSGILIRRAINKYGKQNFKKEILFESNDKNLINEMEKYFIQIYNSQDKRNGYNIAFGGEGGNTLSNHPDKKNICNKISEIKKGVKVHTKESKMKISNTLKRRYANGEIIQHTSEKERKRRSERMKINNPYNDIELRKKISIMFSGDKNPSAKIWVFIHEDGTSVNIKGNFQGFCKEHNLSIKIMRNIADNKRKNKHHNGWTVIRKE